MKWASYNFIPEEFRTPKVEGFKVVMIDDMRPCPDRHASVIYWTALREKDGMELRGEVFVSARELMETRMDMKDYLRALIQNLCWTIRSYADCDCQTWYDPQTRKLYLLDCEAHADKGHSSHPRDGGRTSGTTQAP